MTTEQLPAPIIPAHATTFPANGGSVSVYRDGECVTMVSQYRGGSYMLRMDRERISLDRFGNPETRNRREYAMTAKQLAALRKELRTQDNAYTAEPMFVVFLEERVYGVSPDYPTDGYTWIGEDDPTVTADEDEAKVLEKLLNEDRELSVGGVTFERAWYKIVPRFATACFTRKGAEEYITRHCHPLTNPYIYVESMHRNAEMIALRNHLMGDPCST